MFDGSLPGPAALGGVSDAQLIDAVAGWSRVAAAAQARMFAALAEWDRRTGARAVRPNAVCDDTDNAAAQIACALTVSHGRAVGWMDSAVVLRDRLPRVAALFTAGLVGERVIARILALTRLVVDDAVWAALDEQFAAAATGWGVLSGDKLDAAITVWIHTLDPDAVSRARDRVRQRDFRVGRHDDQTGTTSVYGVVHTVDAALAAARLRAMVTSVCANDPRTLAQRRADAFGAVWAGALTLTCRCADPGCPATRNDTDPAASVVVHIVADAAALDAHPQQQPEPGAGAQTETGAQTEAGAGAGPDAQAEAGAEPAPPGPAAVIAGLRGAVLPAPLLAEVIAAGARVRFVAGVDALTGCPGYRPSTALDEFVRARDLTCRIPGCDRPALYADIDHITPWPGGPTHPANLGCKCRRHHLLKTFWEGWSETQLPDGTLQITTPTGHTYTTRPLSALLFPSWTTTTDPPPPTATTPRPRTPGRDQRMPTRRSTRAHARATAITTERRHNATQRERDRLTAQQTAKDRKAQRDTLRASGPRGAAWAQRLDRLDTINHPTHPTPDHDDDPPPF